MANKLYEENDIRNIAEAIRTKTGKEEQLLVSEMAAEIEGIEVGGGSSSDLPIAEEGSF